MNDVVKTSKELVFLPCPFCGSKPETHSYSMYGKAFAWVKCDRCRLQKVLNTDGEGAENQRFVLQGVAHWWNERHAPETRSPLAQAVLDRVDGTNLGIFITSAVDHIEQGGNYAASEMELGSGIKVEIRLSRVNALKALRVETLPENKP